VVPDRDKANTKGTGQAEFSPGAPLGLVALYYTRGDVSLALEWKLFVATLRIDTTWLQ
jgi:hypothetical protein